MVDALRRALRAVREDGILIDLHPTAAPSAVEVGGESVGYVSAGDAPLRHAAAGAALAQAIDLAWFHVEGSREFAFHTNADSIDELREYIVDNWRDGDIEEPVMSRAREKLAKSAGKSVRVVEQVVLTKLRPSRLQSPGK
jgi:hypothetical protein